MENDKIALKAVNLYKNIGKHHIIKDVSFELKKGEILGLLGQNGSGKTTLLKMFVGLLKPKKGYVQIGQFDI